MESLIKEKREISSLIPYRKTGGGYEFYLQKRGTLTKLNPGIFGLFGGGFEKGETSESALQREIAEELSYKPENAQYFSRFESYISILHVFIEEVSSDFETKVTVGEGEFGAFLTTKEILYSPEVSLMAQHIIHQLVRDVLDKK